jgi:2-haloacid dehalogenase
MPPPVIAFDVNETLLDLSPLDPLLGGPDARARWFGQMLQISFVGAITDRYVDFSTAQRAAARMLGHTNEDEILAQMRALPAHEDARPALQRLSEAEAELTVVALTNSPLDTAQAQLTNAGLIDLFDDVLSADEARALKPRREAYELVKRRHGDDMRLVAAHAWDISGALAAGCKAAFVRRPGKALNPLGDQPDIVGDDLETVAERILASS